MSTEKERNWDGFFNKEKENTKIKEKRDYKAFKQLGMAVVLTTGLMATLFGTVGLYNSHVNEKIKEGEDLVAKSGPTALESLQILSKKNATLFQENKEMLQILDRNEPLLKAMKVGLHVSSLQMENIKRFEKADQKVKEDIASTAKLLEFNQSAKSDREKKETYYLATKDLENFKNANSVNSVNNQELANLNASLKKHTVFLKEAKEEILTSIKEKIAKKDFNIAQKRKEFQSKLTDDIYEEKKGIAELKSEIEKDEELKHAINNSEIEGAEKSINEIETLATQQILKDEKLVNDMIQEISTKGINVQDEAKPINQTQTQTASGGGFNFFHYYLLHQWLNSPSPSTPSAGITSSVAPSYNGSMKSSMVASNPYSFKDPGSHLNQTMAVNGVKTSTGMSYHQLHDNVMKTKTHVSSFKSTRMATRSSVAIKGSSGG